MEDFVNFLKSKKNFTNLVFLLILLVALPVGMGLVRQQQILRSQADTEPIVFIPSSDKLDNKNCVRQDSAGTKYAVCQKVTLQINSPLGPTKSTSVGDCDPNNFDESTWKSKSESRCRRGSKKVKYFCGKKTRTVTKPCNDDGGQTTCDPKNFTTTGDKAWEEVERRQCNKKGKQKVVYRCQNKQKIDTQDCSNASASPTANPSTSALACNPKLKINTTEGKKTLVSTWTERLGARRCNQNDRDRTKYTVRLSYECPSTRGRKARKTIRLKNVTGITNCADFSPKDYLNPAASSSANLYSGDNFEVDSEADEPDNETSLFNQFLNYLLSLIPFEFNFAVQEVYAGHTGDPSCQENGNCDEVVGEYCDPATNKIWQDLRGGDHRGTDRNCGDNAGTDCTYNERFEGTFKNCQNGGIRQCQGVKNSQDVCEFAPGKTNPDECSVVECNSSGGQSCNIGFQGDSLSDPCVNHLKSDRYSDTGTSLVQSIRNTDTAKFQNCSDKQVLNYWCNGGVSEHAKRDCEIKKSEGGQACGRSGGSCNIGFQSPSLSASCVNHLKSDRYSDTGTSLVDSIRDTNQTKFQNCSDQQVLNYWCNGGISQGAKDDCNRKKDEGGRACGRGSGDDGGNGGGGGGGGGRGGGRNRGATPTPAATGYTLKYKIASSEAALESATENAYNSHPLTLAEFDLGSGVGEKIVWVKFFGSQTGNKNDEKWSTNLAQRIKVVESAPLSTNISCRKSLTGEGVVITIDGENFGTAQGKVETKGAGNEEKFPVNIIAPWGPEKINATVDLPGNSEQLGRNLNLIITRADGLSTEGSCTIGAQTSINVGAKLLCRNSRSSGIDGVQVVVSEATKEGQVKVFEDLTISPEGIIEGLDEINFTKDSEYIISVKAPHSVRRNSKPFKAGQGTVQLTLRGNAEDHNKNKLPVGDIAPLDNEDGIIDNNDKFELLREIGPAFSEKPADFNDDNYVNAVDWACMRYDFPLPGQVVKDDPLPGT